MYSPNPKSLEQNVPSHSLALKYSYTQQEKRRKECSFGLKIPPAKMRQPPKSATIPPLDHPAFSQWCGGIPTSQLVRSHGQGQETSQEEESELLCSAHTSRLSAAPSQMLVYYKLDALSPKQPSSRQAPFLLILYTLHAHSYPAQSPTN